MLIASRELYEQLADRCDNAFGLTKRGMMILCRTRAGLEEETRAARRARELDLPVEIVSSTRAAEIDPGIAMEITGAVFYPLDAHLDPRLLMRKLTDLVSAAGVPIHWSTRLDAWRTTGANQRPGGSHALARWKTAGWIVSLGALQSNTLCRAHRRPSAGLSRRSAIGTLEWRSR